MATLWNRKSVEVGCCLFVDIFAELGDGFFVFLVPAVTQTLEEQEWEDEVTQVGGVNGASKDVGGFPEPGFDFLLRCHQLPICA